jgi:molybdopterin molybdotransferase
LKTAEGTIGVEKFARDGSGLITSLRAADGLIEIPEDLPGVRSGDLVSFIPFSEFGIGN